MGSRPPASSNGHTRISPQFLLRGTVTRSGNSMMLHVADVGALLESYSDKGVAGLSLFATNALLYPAFKQVEFYRL